MEGHGKLPAPVIDRPRKAAVITHVCALCIVGAPLVRDADGRPWHRIEADGDLELCGHAVPEGEA